MLIELCIEYGTKMGGYWGSGHIAFLPSCAKGHQASLKCHSMRWDCPDYWPSKGKDRSVSKKEMHDA